MQPTARVVLGALRLVPDVSSTTLEMTPNKYERFVSAYLRLNGYLQVQNFIVHAGDDPGRISDGHVGNYTECDTLAIRMPHSSEKTGDLQILNHTLLTADTKQRADVVIAEAKSGGENRPNKSWRAGTPDPVVSYVVRFLGVHPPSKQEAVALSLATAFSFGDDLARYRYVIFSHTPNTYYQGKGVTYITYREAAAFVVEVRGQCWIESAIGVTSVHQQWDDMLVELFRCANSQDKTSDQRIADIEKYLAT